MSQWFQAWRREAYVETTWDEIDSTFEFAEKTLQDGLETEYRHTEGGRVFDWRYEWRVEPGQGSIEVVENTYVSRGWFVSSMVLLLSCLVCYTVGSERIGLWNIALMILSAVSISAFLVVASSAFRLHSPVQDFFENAPDQDVLMPPLTLYIALFPPVLLVLFQESVLQYIGIGGAALVHMVYISFGREIKQATFRWQRRFVEVMKGTPSLPMDYLFDLFIFSAPMLCMMLLFRERVFLLASRAYPYIVTVLITFLFLGVFKLTVEGKTHSQNFGKNRLRSQGRNVSSRFFIPFSAVIILIVAAGFAVLVFLFLRESMQFLSTVPTFPSIIVIATAALPVFYLVAGFSYQYITTLRHLLRLAVGMKPCDLTDDYYTETDTYVARFDGYFAGAGSFGWKDFIVVSEPLKEELTAEQLDAIVAHEDCHVVNREARFSVLTALLSPVFILGKNVVYGLFDFRKREYRADGYAAEMTSPEQIVDALEKIQELKIEGSTDGDDLNAVTPTLVPATEEEETSDDESFAERYLEFYFGEFAVTEVHPGLGERISKIRKE